MMVWLEDAPKLDIDPERSIEWIDGLISCDIEVEGVIHQQHKHTKSCQRKTKDGIVCRFNIPYPPMQETCILTPFAKDYPRSKKKRGKEVLSTIKEYLEVHKKDLPDWSFEAFLHHFKLHEKEYIEAIRSTIKRPTVVLRRNLKSCFTNAYIPSLAKVWRSNMDVQPIIDPFGVARYIASYMTKASGGISKLMKETSDQIKGGNLSVKSITQTTCWYNLKGSYKPYFVFSLRTR